MSLDLFVFLAVGTPLDTDSLTEAAKKFEPPAVYESKVDLSTHKGFSPVILDGVKTGVETYKIQYTSLAEHLPQNQKINPEDTIVIHFRWGGDMYEGAVALYTAAVYASTYNGIAFDPMSGVYLSEEQLIQGYQAFMHEAR